jgi:uncharacterized protein (DUF1330 family)
MPKEYVIPIESAKDRAGMDRAGMDRAGMDACGWSAGPSMARGGASVLAVDGRPQLRQGEWHERTVDLEFESAEAARAWYEAEAHRRAKPLRQAETDTNAVIVSRFGALSRGE